MTYWINVTLHVADVTASDSALPVNSPTCLRDGFQFCCFGSHHGADHASLVNQGRRSIASVEAEKASAEVLCGLNLERIALIFGHSLVHWSSRQHAGRMGFAAASAILATEDARREPRPGCRGSFFMCYASLPPLRTIKVN